MPPGKSLSRPTGVQIPIFLCNFEPASESTPLRTSSIKWVMVTLQKGVGRILGGEKKCSWYIVGVQFPRGMGRVELEH